MKSEGEGKGFEAWVESRDGRVRLNEYQVEHHPTRDGKSAYTECYLETIDDPIRIKVAKLPTLTLKTDWSCRCSIDGNDLSYSVWLAKFPTHRWKRIYQKDGNQHYICSLQFSPLPTTDDATQVTIKPTAWKDLGSIEITLQRGTWSPSRPHGLNVSDLTEGTADEKSKKFAYTVKTGDRIPIANKMVTAYSFTPHQTGEIHHRFIFKYRSLAALIKANVMDAPRPEVPARPAKRKRADTSVISVEDDEEGDVKPAMAKRLKYLEGRVQALSSENKRLRTGSADINDFIDLTRDSDDDLEDGK